MILSLFRKNADHGAVYAAYNAIVAQSRHRRFYADWQVPDTVTGRFDMISLHLCLLFRRLRTGEEPHRLFSQQVFDLFFKDMDRSLREMGAGDLAVPKRIQSMGELFYGLLAGLNEGLDENDPARLEDVLARNLYNGEAVAGLEQLAGYVRGAEAQLNTQPVDTILNGELTFPEPR